jgi:hypothetical protein
MIDDSVKAVTALQSVSVSIVIVEYSSKGPYDVNFLKAIHDQRKDLLMVLVVPSSDMGFNADLFALPIMACLTQPMDFSRMMELIQMARKCHLTMTAIHESHLQLEKWARELAEMRAVLQENPRAGAFLSLDSFLTLTFQNILEALMDVKQVTKASFNPDIEPEACHLFTCSRLMKLTDALLETVDVLEKTKHAFKSHELGMLRQQLEQVLHN